MIKKVLLPDDISEAGKKIMEAAGLDIVIGSGRSAEQMKNEGADAAAVLIGTQTFDAEIMEAMPKLKVIARNGVGYDSVDVVAASERGIYVLNTPEALSDSVAESTVAEMLALSKNIFQNSQALYRGDWNYKRSRPGHDLAGETVGILGFGRIGRAVAKRLLAFDMRVIAYDPHAQSTDSVEILSRQEVFRQSDYVSVHLPAVKETVASIGAEEFALTKNSAYLINLARGSILNEAELVIALESHQIAGAALDVYEKEPLPLESPLLRLENVLLTPHIASNTVETRERMAIHAAQGIVDVLSGKSPRWAVNKPK